MVTWDDHEVQNDYANTQSQYEGEISALRAAYQAWYEFFDGYRRGYIRCQVGRSQLRADLQVVTTVSRPDAPESTFASFVVEHGRPGAHRLA